MTDIDRFVELFRSYNQSVNLVSATDAGVLKEKHVEDSLKIELFLQKYGMRQKNGLKLLDIGTGGGFPAVPIAVMHKDIEVTAVDSIQKKINFLMHAKEQLCLDNLFPLCARIEELPESMRASFDVVTTRALSELNVILEYAIPFLKTGGYFVAYKSKTADEELLRAKAAMSILNVKFVEKLEYTLCDEFSRSLLVFQKLKPTPKAYPRKNGMIKKQPLK